MNHHIHPDEVIPIPTNITTNPTSQTLGNNISVTVTLDQTVSSASSFKLNTDHPSLINPPSGSSWPASIPIPAGASAVTFTLTTTGTIGASAKLGACPSNADATNQANWTATCIVSLLTPPG